MFAMQGITTPPQPAPGCRRLVGQYLFILAGINSIIYAPSFYNRRSLPKATGTMEKTSLLESTQSPARQASWRKVPWLLELGALLLSLSSLITAAAILASQDGKSVTGWRLPLSLNTVVAVLGAINKGTLAFVVSACIGQHKWNLFKAERGKLALFERFDEASRGPWGSTRLMFETRLRSV